MSDFNIKQIRSDLGLTQVEMAKKLGVDTKTVQNWEYGVTKIPKSKYGILGSLLPISDDLPGDLGFTVKELRQRLGITQVELASKLGVTENTIQNWERGKKIPATKHKPLQDLWGSVPTLAIHTHYGGASDDAPKIVPLIPIWAQGGTLNDFTRSVMEYDCEKVVSPIRGVDYAITVSGDSMSPEYPSGSQILIKKINERAFIDWGKVYVLDTINGTVIKKLMPVEDDASKVLCVSVNPCYPAFKVCLEHVYGIYRVLMCMSLK